MEHVPPTLETVAAYEPPAIAHRQPIEGLLITAKSDAQQIPN